MEQDSNEFKHINHDRVALITYDEFIGYAKRIIADNKINIEEAKQIALWLDANAVYLYDYIDIDLLINTIKHSIDDDIITNEDKTTFPIFKVYEYFKNNKDFSDNIELLSILKNIYDGNLITNQKYLYLVYLLIILNHILNLKIKYSLSLDSLLLILELNMLKK